MTAAECAGLFGLATEALGRYRLRTALSVLGVVLGVAAVIAMMSISEGAARRSLADVDGLGLDNLIVRSSGDAATLARGGTLRAGDAERLATLVPMIAAASPLLERRTRVTADGRAQQVLVVGVRPAFGDILRLTAGRGRLLAPSDEAASARVCVLGATLARQLFGYRDPVGEVVQIAGEHHRVVGVLAAQTTSHDTATALAWRDTDTLVMVPFPTLSTRTLAVVPDQPTDEIWLQVTDGTQVEALANAVAQTIRVADAGSAFDIVVPRQLLAQRYRTQRTFSIVIGSVAAIALLVGGIGIMNIMLTSVVERTREIGIRRTAGATRRDIRLQFLAEALLMTLSGGVAGIGLGVAASFGITWYAAWTTHVSAVSVVAGFLASAVVGVTFGLYPAMKAASLEPVEAMRYE